MILHRSRTTFSMCGVVRGQGMQIWTQGQALYGEGHQQEAMQQCQSEVAHAVVPLPSCAGETASLDAAGKAGCKGGDHDGCASDPGGCRQVPAADGFAGQVCAGEPQARYLNPFLSFCTPSQHKCHLIRWRHSAQDHVLHPRCWPSRFARPVYTYTVPVVLTLHRLLLHPVRLQPLEHAIDSSGICLAGAGMTECTTGFRACRCYKNQVMLIRMSCWPSCTIGLMNEGKGLSPG